MVNFVHLLREKEKLEAFDSVRGVFTEGGALYPGAKIMAKTHVRACVRNPKASITKKRLLVRQRCSYLQH